MVSGYASTGSGVRTMVFDDITLVDGGDTFVYSCRVGDVELFFETVAFPSGRELLDAALWAYKESER